MADIRSTYGSLLLGGLLALALSGGATVQTYMYLKMYPRDRKRLKALVLSVWLLDTCHTALICASTWNYFITHFGDSAYIDHISSTLALTILFTAVLTFLVQCFFAQRIYKLSNRNMYITVPLCALVLLRLAAATVSTAEMLRLRSFSKFVAECEWMFTLGLASSTGGDVLITVFLCYFLRAGRKGTSSLDHVLNLLTLYTFENAAMTCAATIASLICWLSMPHNLVFLGLHFAISKTYFNSLMATLNARHGLKHTTPGSSSNGHGIPVMLPGAFAMKDRYSARPSAQAPSGGNDDTTQRPEINTNKTVDQDTDAPQSA